ncbi:uncharacterized protein LOC106376477 [Brassica napus]|uniref:uncharacterized protein LOC106376477 n=1 Tax=Brassica napus TaxID=3708 RepID=UPI000BBE08E9|nr:uncharacterized protein LOC106376477 [Brassica napus]
MKRNPWKFLVLLIVFDNTVKCILLKNNRFLEISVSGDQEHHASNLTGLQSSKEGSNFWGGLKGSVIFALGFHSHGVLFPNPERVLQEATESLAQAESLSGEYYAQLDELIENKKVLDEALQLYLAGLAELEELKEAKGL